MDRKPGLPSIHEARQQRQTKGRWSHATPSFWLLSLGGILVLMLIYRFFSGRELNERRVGLLAKQRAVDTTVGAEWYALRDRLESIAVDTSTRWSGEDFVDPESSSWDFRALPGVYLRLRVGEARDVTELRKNAGGSVRDGFVGCLLREPNQAAARGEADAGAFADQPWNLRQGYASTRILTEDWQKEVREATDDIRLRIFEQQFDKASRTEIPMAVDLIKRAQFFLLVLDEDADPTPENNDKLASRLDGGAVTSEVLQLVPHAARVRIVSLRTGKDVARLTRTAQGTAMMMGGAGGLDPETQDALTRQVNNCALARQVQQAIGLH